MPDIVPYAVAGGVLAWNALVVWWFMRLVRPRVPVPKGIKRPPLRPGRVVR